VLRFHREIGNEREILAKKKRQRKRENKAVTENINDKKNPASKTKMVKA